ncbi:MAG TPA: cysteine-rich CWC family protein [Ramlibacter sp.]|nr:cysteine-rich CWC family protein [Ramlibacter sp.]
MPAPSAASPVQPQSCPLCGQANRCAMEVERATGVKQEACWCTGVDFSAELLARVPAEAQRLACICADCAARAGPRATPAAQ